MQRLKDKAPRYASLRTGWRPHRTHPRRHGNCDPRPLDHLGRTSNQKYPARPTLCCDRQHL